MFRRKHYTKFRTRHKHRRWMLIMLVILFALFVPAVLAFLDVFQIGGEATAEIFGVAVTALGAIFVIFELQDNERVTCCDMMASMNFQFIENKRLMMLYQELEDCYRNPDKKLQITDDGDDKKLHTSDMMAYFTFYEVLYEYIKHGITDIKQMDDLFGDRFFKLIHNPFVQEHELYPVPSSYANIFELYGEWWEYRVASSADEKRLMAMKQNAIPEIYWKEKLYLQESAYMDIVPQKIILTHKEKGTKEFELRRLFPRNLKEVMNLQARVSNVLDVPKVFALTSEEEFLESMLVDYCYGIFDGEKLIAQSISVLNRESYRNLGQTCLQERAVEYVTFDTIQVHEEYRGYGIQKFFIQEAERLVQLVEAKYILATVSPENVPSLRNFEESGFKSIRTQKMSGKLYGNAMRELVCKQVRE